MTMGTSIPVSALAGAIVSAATAAADGTRELLALHPAAVAVAQPERVELVLDRGVEIPLGAAPVAFLVRRNERGRCQLDGLEGARLHLLGQLQPDRDAGDL